jgi:hypothetical protein
MRLVEKETRDRDVELRVEREHTTDKHRDKQRDHKTRSIHARGLAEPARKGKACAPQRIPLR